MEMQTVSIHFLDAAEEADEEDVQLNPREVRDMHNVLELPINKFIAHFRVSKEIFKFLLEKFKSKQEAPLKCTYIHEDIKLATFLRFLATGGYQQNLGNEISTYMAKSSVSAVITECLTFFQEHICADWIKMPGAEEEKTIKENFFRTTGFPGIVGCVDGTHIKIKSPGPNLKHLYYNRKGYYSINTMVVCDHNAKILYVDARHPGANHDAFVWEQSFPEQNLRNSFESGQINTWILGDAGYKLKPYLMTPFRSPANATEITYNKKHARARNVVERCFGVLKNRFRSIIDSRGLHYQPEKVTQIINACCALHNMCNYYKCQEPPINLESEDTIDDNEQTEEGDVGAKAIRQRIALSF